MLFKLLINQKLITLSKVVQNQFHIKQFKHTLLYDSSYVIQR